MEFGSPERQNPFHEGHNASSSLRNIYESQTEQEPCRETDRFFDDPFKNAGIHSSVSDLEDWVLQCKHMYLTSRDKPQTIQKLILKRLVELRRLLHLVKERELASTSSNPSAAQPAPIFPTVAANTLGHAFRAVPSIRFLGIVCDSCTKTVRSPTGTVLICQNCCVTCHDSSGCIQSLLRFCPASPASTELTLEVLKGVQFGASLSSQGWRCWSCKALLRPPQPTSQSPLPSPNFLQDSLPIPSVLKAPPSELVASIHRMERTPTPVEVRLKQVTTAAQEIAGLFSPSLGPIQTPADVSVVIQQCRLEKEAEASVAKLCYYSGKFYCSACHWGDNWCIPGKVFSMGITRPFPVCRDSVIALDYMWSRQQFRAPDGWQRWNAQAVLMASLRLRAHRLIPKYFRLCEEANGLRKKFQETQPTWLLEQPFTYTMWIVDQVLDGSLIDSMTEFLAQVEEHVNNCALCVTLGQSMCLVCRQTCPQPYQHCSAICSSCGNVVHRTCLEPPLKADLDDLKSNLEKLKSQQGCPSSLKVEDILETLYPAPKPTRCRLCCD
ncbi:hypothetical protein Aperf_G00000085081 [Anoplocephala perfoliata]